MIAGRVIGEVWATRKARGLEGRRLVLVAVDGRDRAMVAIDTLDARAGQKVLVSVGSGARNVLRPGRTTARSVRCRDLAVGRRRGLNPRGPLGPHRSADVGEKSCFSAR